MPAFLDFVFVATMITGWLTHAVECFHDGSYFFFVFGTILFPFGILHGWCVWIGWA